MHVLYNLENINIACNRHPSQNFGLEGAHYSTYLTLASKETNDNDVIDDDIYDHDDYDDSDDHDDNNDNDGNDCNDGNNKYGNYDDDNEHN